MFVRAEQPRRRMAAPLRGVSLWLLVLFALAGASAVRHFALFSHERAAEHAIVAASDSDLPRCDAERCLFIAAMHQLHSAPRIESPVVHPLLVGAPHTLWVASGATPPREPLFRLAPSQSPPV